MISLDEYTSLVQKYILPRMDAFEAERIEVKKKTFGVWKAIGAGMLVFILGSVTNVLLMENAGIQIPEMALRLFFIGVVIGTIVIAVKRQKEFNRLKTDLLAKLSEQRISHKLAEMLLPEANYKQSEFIPLEEAEESLLFEKHYMKMGKIGQNFGTRMLDSLKGDGPNILSQPLEEYTGDDLFTGELNGVPYKFSEVTHHTKYRSKTVASRNKNSTSAPVHVVTKGVLFIASPEKPFAGTTVLLSGSQRFYFYKKVSQKFGISLEKHQIQTDPNTNDMLAFTTHPEEANQLISHEMMDSITQFNQQAWAKLSGFNHPGITLSFRNNHIYVFNPNFGLFEFDIQKTFLDIKLYVSFYQQLRFTMELVESLLGQEKPAVV